MSAGSIGAAALSVAALIDVISPAPSVQSSLAPPRLPSAPSLDALMLLVVPAVAAGLPCVIRLPLLYVARV